MQTLLRKISETFLSQNLNELIITYMVKKVQSNQTNHKTRPVFIGLVA